MVPIRRAREAELAVRPLLARPACGPVRRAIIAVAAAGIVAGTAACSASGAHHGGGGLKGRWAIGSCQVVVTYLDEVNTLDYYVPIRAPTSGGTTWTTGPVVTPAWQS